MREFQLLVFFFFFNRQFLFQIKCSVLFFILFCFLFPCNNHAKGNNISRAGPRVSPTSPWAGATPSLRQPIEKKNYNIHKKKLLVYINFFLLLYIK